MGYYNRNCLISDQGFISDLKIFQKLNKSYIISEYISVYQS